jgi:hypothetical protein
MGEWKHSPIILNLDTSRNQVVGFTSRPLYPHRNCTQNTLDKRLGLDDAEKREILALPGIKHRTTSPQPFAKPTEQSQLVIWEVHEMYAHDRSLRSTTRNNKDDEANACTRKYFSEASVV